MEKLYFKKAQSGRSMIEMLGVLAIIGVLSAGGIAGYSMAMSSYKANTLMDKIQMISTQARILYSDGKYPASTMVSELQSLKGIDATNPFDGTITVVGDNTIGGIFTITATDVPKDACVKYLTSSWGDSSIFANIGTTASNAKSTWNVSDALAATACGKADGNPSVIWTFK